MSVTSNDEFARGRASAFQEVRDIIKTHHAPFHWYWQWLLKHLDLIESRPPQGEH